MFRLKRSDALVSSVEATYNLSFNVRSDARIGNLLSTRGFDSVTQLVKAARGGLTQHARPRNVFLSFHRDDLAQVTGFRLMMQNRHIRLSISDEENRWPVSSIQASYIKRALKQRIESVDVLICMIGNGTAWREWVDWEIQTALFARKGICGIRLKNSRGRVPPLLKTIGAPIASWNVSSMTAAIECAAALRT
jgi:hypothetical protein